MTTNDLEHERQIQGFPDPKHGRPTPYHFTPDEIRVLRECNRESFLQRCIPLSTLMGLGTYYGVQAGFLKPNARYGPTPKVVVAVILGYFIGKISYQPKCAEKLMHLPNSPVGELIRRKRQGLPTEGFDSGFGPGMSIGPFGGMGSPDVYTDVDAKPGLDLDTTRPDMEGLNDSHRPTVDSDTYEEDMPPVQKKSTTYDELRKRNREEYQQKRSFYRNSPQATTLPQRETPAPSDGVNPELPSVSIPKGRTNKYGDLME